MSEMQAERTAEIRSGIKSEIRAGIESEIESEIRAEVLPQHCSLHEALQTAVAYLQSCDIEDAQTDAWLLMEFVTGIRRAMFLAERMRPMKDEDRERYEALLQKRGTHIPLQHLTGEQEFMGFPFLVNEHVLIPRQDTEILVEEALKRIRKGMHILDLCTGSGCIAVSLAKLGAQDAGSMWADRSDDAEKQHVSVDGADISEEALKVAKSNGERLEAQVRWMHGDLFEAVERTREEICDKSCDKDCDIDCDKGYDMIVSNPPYIRTSVITELSEEVRLHEPFGALDGKEDGLYFYRRIIEESSAYLRAEGWLLFEIGYDQGADVKALMEENGYREVQVIQDLAGLDRVVLGQRNGG